MPVYEYKCLKCNHKQEKLVRGKESLVRCEKCGGRAQKIMSVPYLNNYPIKAVRLNGEEIR